MVEKPVAEIALTAAADSADQRALFCEIARTRMPFGRYAGRRLIELPEPYVLWFKRAGFPPGKLGRMLAVVHEVQLNGLEGLFDPFREGE